MTTKLSEKGRRMKADMASETEIDRAIDGRINQAAGTGTGMSDPRRSVGAGAKPRLSHAERLRLARIRAFNRVMQYQRLEALRRVWSDIGVHADKHGRQGLLELAIESEDRISAALKQLERSCREADKLCDDEPRHVEWLRDHRERVEAMDDPDDPIDDAGDGSGDDLRRPSDLAGLLGMLPGRSRDMRMW